MSSSSSTEPARGFKPFGIEPVSMEDVEAKNEKAYPKEKMEKYQKIKDRIIGAENWDLYRDISHVVGPGQKTIY